MYDTRVHTALTKSGPFLTASQMLNWSSCVLHKSRLAANSGQS